MAERVRESPWRNSTGTVVRVLVAWDGFDERMAGWRLAKKLEEPVGWSPEEVDQAMSDPRPELRIAAIDSIATTDPRSLARGLERVLKDPAQPLECREAAVRTLPRVPAVLTRGELWKVAAADRSLRWACLATFSSVAAIESVLPIAAGFLDDRKLLHIAVSNHFGLPSEVRIEACRPLARFAGDREFIASELFRRLEAEPMERDLPFQIELLRCLNEIRPAAPELPKRAIEWLKAFPSARGMVLDAVGGRLPAADAIEAELLAIGGGWPPEEKCDFCRWLAERQSPATLRRLATLLQDEHPGVRLAAAVSWGAVDPAAPIRKLREELLPAAVSDPDRFAIGFLDRDEAMAALALAGNSYDDAIEWLARPRDEDLTKICREASDRIETWKEFGLLGVTRLRTPRLFPQGE